VLRLRVRTVVELVCEGLRKNKPAMISTSKTLKKTLKTESLDFLNRLDKALDICV